LNQIQREGQLLRIGAAVTLQQLMDTKICQKACGESVRKPDRGNGVNMRRTATVGGTIGEL
jgi:CO/xanthine dehydrogenase FAD-binding subunit